MIDLFGESAATARVYAVLVEHPGSTPAELAARVGLDAAAVSDALAALAGRGFAAEQSGGWDVLPPEAVAAELRAEQARRTTRTDAALRTLESAYRDARRGLPNLPPMDLLHDPEQIHRQWFAMQLGATTEILNLERPPYLTARHDDRPHLLRQIEVQHDRAAAGVVYRTVYERSVLDDPVYGRLVVDNIAMGNRARTLPAVPVKLAVVDRRSALLQLDVRPSDREPDYRGGVLVIHPSGLLDVLVEVFESLWTLSVPVTVEGPDRSSIDRLDRDILALMAVGATDDVIAARLDVSRRTVVRHTATLLERLGATNRFQAGVQAAHRGWL